MENRINDTVKIERLSDLSRIPLSVDQKRLWIVSQQEKSASSYNLDLTYLIEGELEINLLQKSLSLLFEKQQVMFSVFQPFEGAPFCMIRPVPVITEFIDLSEEGPDIAKKKVLSIIEDDIQKPFNLEKGPLYRLFIFRSAPREHYFHATIHHIIFDGWSKRLFIQELSGIYNDLKSGRDRKVEPLLFQYFDYAHWEEIHKDPSVEIKLIKFWKDQLAGISSELKFPYDFPRKGIPTGLGEREFFRIPESQYLKLKKISELSGNSMFVTVLAILSIILYKYSGEKDICIGVPISSRRNHPYLKEIFGNFIRTTVIRLIFKENRNFIEHLKYTAGVVRKTIDNSGLPFEKIVEVANPERISDVNPLFQVALSWRNNIDVPLELDGAKGERIRINKGVSPLDISFYMWENGTEIEGELEYSTDLLKKETISSICENLLSLVGNLIENPGKELDSISVISEKEKQWILDINKTQSFYPKDKTVASLFAEQAARFPEKNAIVSRNITVSYSELNRKSNKLAGLILEKNSAGRNVPIGILADKSPDLIIGLLGILKSGGAYVPLDPDFPPERISFILNDTGCELLLTQQKHDHLINDHVPVILLDSEDTYSGEETIPVSDGLPQDLAYIMYTSGTTGVPKGSKITNRGVVRLVRNTNYITLTEKDKIILAGAIVFDATTFEIWGALLNGGTLYILEKEDILDPNKLSENIDKYCITTILLTSSLFTQIASYKTDVFRNLQHLLVGGDVLSPIPANKVRRDNPHLILTNLYGPTENSCISTYYKVEKEHSQSIPIGRPISNSTAYIFDRKLNFQPIGVIGELYVGGDGVSDGYVNREDLNRESFIYHPDIPGEKLYKTGDYARWLPDGNIEFHGRMDNQLKIRGYRVELDEIESVLSGIEGVNNAVVKPFRTKTNDVKLVGFVCVSDMVSVSPEHIIHRLRTKIPSYMIPSAIKIIDRMPLTINGKIDRKSSLFDYSETEDISALEPLRQTITENRLYSIWRDLLNTKEIKPDESFFDAGGNSLLAISLLNKVEDEFRIGITYKDLINNNTIDDLGKFIDSSLTVKLPSAEIIHLEGQNEFPLTQSQKRLWLLSRMNPSLPSYVLSFAYLLSGSLNVEIFRKSLVHLFDRHHVLYTRIAERDGNPHCVINKKDLNFGFRDLGSLPLSQAESEISGFMRDDSRRAFDLSSGPLYRLFLFRINPEKYYFYISVHHIIFDGWSWKVFINDLNTIYDDLSGSKEVSLSRLTYQQYDFADWERRNNLLKDEDKLIEYWRDRMEGGSSLLNFPYDFPRPDVPSGFGDMLHLKFSEEVSSALRSFTRAENVSLFAVMLSTFGVLLSKYSGEYDINIGTPVANRSNSAFENVVGMFVNTIVIRQILEQDLSFADLVKKTHNQILDSITHQDLQFEKLVEIIKPERFPNTNPIFQMAFAWEDNLGIPLRLKGVTSQRVTITGGTSLFDITCSMWDNGRCIEGELLYDLDLFCTGTIERLRKNYLNLVSNLISKCDTAIKNIPLVTDEEKQILLSLAGHTTPYPKDKTLRELFEEQVRLYPDKTAICFKDEYLTFKELNQRSDKLALTIRDRGVISGNTPIAILADKSVELIVGLLGIIKSGGAYIPLDPEYPGERIRFIIKDAGCRILLVQNKYMGLAVEEVRTIDLNDTATYNPDGTLPENINNSGDLAYIMYTSGTTGNPKGSMIRQYSIIRLVRNTNYIDLQPCDRLLLTSSIVFDVATFEIWGALLNGLTLYLAEKETILDPIALGNEILEKNITILWLTSSLFSHISELHPDIFYKLKYLLVGGDVLSPVHINRVRKVNPGLKIINGYGPTENTTFSACFEIDKDYEFNIPIGRPISNSTAYVFDANLNLQPVGVTGELYVGGDGVSSGYLNREDLNKTSFLFHPEIPGDRLYKTGDFARWLPEGVLEFHGRLDDQIKIRGFRVETGEIETEISRIKGVVDAVVKSYRTESGDIRLVAFINIPMNFPYGHDEILRTLRTRLPSYMLPSAIRLMHGMPLTINGKVDKKALKFELNDLVYPQKGEEVFQTTTENKLLRIWSIVLKTSEIKRTDRFFDVGGNSLLAISLINRIEEEFRLNISYKDLISIPTISELGKFIDSHKPDLDTTVEVVHLEGVNEFPLTHGQHRMWLVNRMNPDLPGYIMPFIYHLSGPLEVETFIRSLEILFARHHTLYSRIAEKEGRPYCIIDQTDLNLEFIDYSLLPVKDGESAMNDFIRKDTRRVFDLYQGPLYRLFLFKIRKEEYRFYFVFHHLIFDGWSWKIFISDLNIIYNDLVTGSEVSLKALKFQQYDFAEWERKVSLAKDEKELAEFWKKQMDGCSSLINFPYDFPRSLTSTGNGNTWHIQFNETISERLSRFSRKEGVSLFATMLSTFGILLYKYSGDRDINIGTPVANRSHVALEDIVGMFVDTLVIRMKFNQGDTFRELVHRTNGQMLDCIAHQDLQFERIVEMVKPERIQNANPLFQIAFAWEDNLNVPLNLKDVKSQKVPLHEVASIFDLTFTMWNSGSNIEGDLYYNTDLLTEDTVLRLRENYKNLVSNLLDYNDHPLEKVQLVSDKEKQNIVHINNTSFPYPGDKTISQLFEEQVKLNPEKSAVIFKDKYLTYDSLNRMSNRLSGILRQTLHDSRNQPVGILADKSIELIVGFLGILKSGSSYLPVDPEYPLARMNFILSDSGCRVIVIQKKYADLNLEGVKKIILDPPSGFPGDDSDKDSGITSEDLAYIMYTSGTTGNPKGSMIRQKSVVRLVRNINYMELTGNDRVLMTGAIVFDAITFEIWGALLNGGTLFIAEKETILDPVALASEIDKNKITILWLTSSLLTQIAELHSDIFGSLKYLLTGGDVVSAPHINKIRKNNPGLKVVNCYGPTENTTFSTTYLIERDFESNIPIGKPVSNSTAYILDNNLNFQPVGVVGELYVGGEGVSKGYLNRDDLNKACFITHPEIPEDRLYKTGDYARWLPDGNIEFRGRIDNQLKIRGFRVELGEIESAISGIDGVVETVVKPVRTSEGDLRLIAFLNINKDFSSDIKDIERYVRSHMPVYMVPSAYILMHGFPLTPGGKTDRKALSYDLNEAVSEGTNSPDSMTETEKTIYRIWRDTLKTTDISVSDNFFDVGGNSLTAVSVFSKMEKELDIRLGLRVFFERPTIKDFAEIVDYMRTKDDDQKNNINSNSQFIEGEI
jgi:amino acid adenylation domain-containing protein